MTSDEDDEMFSERAGIEAGQMKSARKATGSLAELGNRHSAGARTQLGRFLVGAGIVSEEQLNQGLQVARDSHQPIGRVLVMLKYLREQDLQSALLAQKMVFKKDINQGAAVQALRLASERRIGIEEIIVVAATDCKGVQSEERLYDFSSLMVAAGCINDETRLKTHEQSVTSGLLFGKVLLTNQSVSVTTLNNALAAFLMVDEQLVTRDVAVRLLKRAHSQGCDLATASASLSSTRALQKASVRLGEILILSNLVPVKELLSALEVSIFERRLLGEVLVEANLIDRRILPIALTLQEFVNKQLLTKDQAKDALSMAHQRELTLASVLAELNLFSKASHSCDLALTLLQIAGVIDNSILSAVQHTAGSYKLHAIEALALEGAVETRIIEAARESAASVIRNDISQEKAVELISYCLTQSCDVRTASRALKIQLNGSAGSEITSANVVSRPVPSLSGIAVFLKSPEFICMTIATAVACGMDAMLNSIPAIDATGAFAMLLPRTSVEWLVANHFPSHLNPYLSILVAFFALVCVVAFGKRYITRVISNKSRFEDHLVAAQGTLKRLNRSVQR